MSRKALIVGIDYYENVSPLHGCVNDAYNVKSVLNRNYDGTPNFAIRQLIGSGPQSKITRKLLKDSILELFTGSPEVALLYFSGHGYIENCGGYLITSECSTGDDGLSLSELLTIANESSATSKIIVLDSCHSGYAGKIARTLGNASLLSEGVTILTASGEDQYATEENYSGLFTTLFVDAMNGSAANLLGDITPGSVYAHIDQSLGAWQQRPIFKTNVKNFTTLRKVSPPIPRENLYALKELFPHYSDEFELDPSFEPDSDSPNEDNIEKFKILQRCNRVNLVVPVDEEHMYYAAMNSKSCKLTPLGIHYWNLVVKERI